MKAIILAGAAALALAAAAPPAEAGNWSMNWTGPRGGTYQGGGKCSQSACQSAGTFTGPFGGVWRHTGEAQRVGPGQWTGQGALTGPNGQTAKHSWTWSAN
jgi:hypothetical protein